MWNMGFPHPETRYPPTHPPTHPYDTHSSSFQPPPSPLPSHPPTHPPQTNRQDTLKHMRSLEFFGPGFTPQQYADLSLLEKEVRRPTHPPHPPTHPPNPPTQTTHLTLFSLPFLPSHPPTHPPTHLPQADGMLLVTLADVHLDRPNSLEKLRVSPSSHPPTHPPHPSSQYLIPTALISSTFLYPTHQPTHHTHPGPFPRIRRSLSRRRLHPPHLRPDGRLHLQTGRPRPRRNHPAPRYVRPPTHPPTHPLVHSSSFEPPRPPLPNPPTHLSPTGYFDGLASLLKHDAPTLCAEATFLFVPGPHDPGKPPTHP